MKINKNIAFTEKDHKYFDIESGEQYTSVTQFIHKFIPEFDEEYWSKYKAAERLLSPKKFKEVKKLYPEREEKLNALLALLSPESVKAEQEVILKEWEENNKKATDKGTLYHNDREKEINKEGIKSEWGEVINTLPSMELVLDFDSDGVFAEYLIFDEELKIAGQIDRINKKGRTIDILDYKTNKELKFESFFDLKTKRYDSLKPPLSHLMNCNWVHYCLQLSMYAYLFERKGFKIGKVEVEHVDLSMNEDNTYEVKSKRLLEVPYQQYKDEIKKILKYDISK